MTSRSIWCWAGLAVWLVGGCAEAPVPIRPQDLSSVAGLGSDKASYLRTLKGERTVTGSTRVALHLDPEPDIPLRIALRDLGVDDGRAVRLPPYDSSSRLALDDIQRAEILPDRTGPNVSLVVTVVGTILVFAGLFALVAAAGSVGGG